MASDNGDLYGDPSKLRHVPADLGWCARRGRYYLTCRGPVPEVRRFGVVSRPSKEGMLRYARSRAACKMAEAQKLMADAQEFLAFADAVEHGDLPQDVEWRRDAEELDLELGKAANP